MIVLVSADNGACAKAYDNGKGKTFFEVETSLNCGTVVALERLRQNWILNGNPRSAMPRPVEG